VEYNPPNTPLYGAPSAEPEPPKLKGRKKDKPDKKVTKKVVNSQLRFAIIFAVVAAVVAALVLAGSTKPSQFVVRAVEPLGAGTAVTSADAKFEAIAITDDLVEKGAYTGTTAKAALDALSEDIGEGTRVQYPIGAREQITKSDFSVELILDTPLKPEERLMSIQATVSNAVAGKVRAGDRVDIAGNDGDVAGVVFRNVEIVAVTVSENQYQSVAEQQRGEGKNTSPDELLPGTPVPGIYTVRVADTDVSALYALSAGSTLSLIYAPADASETPLGATAARDVICGSGTGDKKPAGC
jgi:Flp pilus assembly protein CpaB